MWENSLGSVCRAIAKCSSRIENYNSQKRCGKKACKEHSLSLLHTLQFDLLYHTINDLELFQVVSILENCKYERLNAYIKQIYKKAYQKGQT